MMMARSRRETSTSLVHSPSPRPKLSTSKISPTKRWKIFPLRNGHFEEGVGVKKETAIAGIDCRQRWEWMLSLTSLLTRMTVLLLGSPFSFPLYSVVHI